MKIILTTLLALSAAYAFQENSTLWQEIDRLNQAALSVESTDSSELEELFREAVETAMSSDFQLQFEELRDSAYLSEDFTEVDEYVKRAAPAITVILQGESNAIGVNVEFFLSLAAPGTEAYEFFDLALDGFYMNGEQGTAELPQWMERTGSSAQASANPELAGLYAEIWQGMSIGFHGYYLTVAQQTISALGGGADLSDSELQAYYLVYSDPFALHIRKALNNFLGGSEEGLFMGSYLPEQLNMFREYLSHRFVVLSIDPAGMGGYSILLLSQEKPDRIFEAWVYSLSDGSLELREFSESDQFTRGDVEEIAERYRSFLEDTQHSL